MKRKNTNKGITLIALVITIIVMLILVAVTITMAVNGGLFEYAGSVATHTNDAIANEQQLANLEEGMTVNQLINKYTGSQGETDTINFTFRGWPFSVKEGTTWEQFASEQGNEFWLYNPYVLYIDWIVCYSDKTPVSPSSTIEARLCL